MTKKNKTRSLHLEHTAEHICFSSLIQEDQEMLRKEGLLPSAFSNDVYSIDCCSLNKVRHGIGVMNTNDGVEFWDYRQMKSPVTIHKKGISILPPGEDRASSCCVFATFMDYMAYKTIKKKEEDFLPGEHDCIILNTPLNLSNFLVECSDYDNVYLLLPNSVAGKSLSQTIVGWHTSATDCSGEYVRFRNLFTYVRSKYKTKKKKK